MKIRAFGYSVDTSCFPTATDTPRSFIYTSFQGWGSSPIDDKGLFRGGVVPVSVTFGGAVEDWYAGLLLRARDADTIPLMEKGANGVITVTAKQLEGDVAEVSYFLAHAGTGHGLIACYAGSPNLRRLDWALRKQFKDQKAALRESALKSEDREESKSKTSKKYSGGVRLLPLLREGTLTDIIKTFKRVKTADFKLSGIEDSEGLFQKLSAEARSKVARFTFNPDYIFDSAIADDLELYLKENPDVKASFTGVDQAGHDASVSSEFIRNKFIFGEKKYNDVMNTLTLDWSDLASTISGSQVVEWLKEEVVKEATHDLLATPLPMK